MTLYHFPEFDAKTHWKSSPVNIHNSEYFGSEAMG